MGCALHSTDSTHLGLLFVPKVAYLPSFSAFEASGSPQDLVWSKLNAKGSASAQYYSQLVQELTDHRARFHPVHKVERV